MSNERPEFERRVDGQAIERMRGDTDSLPRHYVSSAWTQSEWGEPQASQDLLDYCRILRLQKFLILRCILLGLLIALTFSICQRSVYRAHTSITIQDMNENFMNLKEDPTAINQGERTESYFQTQVQILQSESLLKRVMNKPDIAEALARTETKSRRIAWRKYLGLPEMPVRSESQQQLLEQIASQLSVRSSGDLHLG